MVSDRRISLIPLSRVYGRFASGGGNATNGRRSNENLSRIRQQGIGISFEYPDGSVCSGHAAGTVHLCSNAGWNTRLPAGAPMTNAEADENERIFVEKAKAWHLELLKAKEQEAAKMPAYPRD